jgi:MFS family permease
MNVNRKQINLYTAMVFASIFFMAMSNNIVGPLLSDIMRHYSITLESGGLMTMYQSIGGTAAIILISFVMDKLNKPVIFMVTVFALSVAMLLIGTAPSYPVFMMLFLFFGISLSTTDVTGNAIIPEVQQEKSDAALSLMHGIASIGCVVAPMIAGGITQSGMPWQNVYTAMSGFFLLVLILYTVTWLFTRKSLKAVKAAQSVHREKGVAKRFVRDKNVWVAVGFTALFGGFQSGILVWVSQYFKDVFGSGQIAAGLALTAYWLGAGIVRLLFGLTPLRKTATQPLAIYGSVISGLLLIIGVLTQNYYAMMICVFFAGCANAPVLPRTMGLVSSWYRSHSGLASSAVFSSLYLAYAFVPLLMGALAAAWGLHALMLVPAACSILAGLLAMLLPGKAAV